MNILTCPLPTFQRLMRALAEDRNRVAFVRVGVHHANSNYEWLVRDFTLATPDSPAPDQDLNFYFSLTTTWPSIPPIPFSSAVVGFLFLGDGPWCGYLWGVVYTGEAIELLQQLSLVGPGMHSIYILNPHTSEIYSSLGSNTVDLRERRELTRSTTSELFPSWEGSEVGFFTRWSRTIGALGGEATWERLTRLRVAIIGCGRIGSLVAVTLARLGIRQLTLIDSDIIEPHNLGEMDAVTDVDLGRPKAEAIVDHLRFLSLQSPKFLVHIATPITHPLALAAAKKSDVLFCCADNDAARLTTAILATLYHKVLIDIGTGIFYQDTTPSPHPPNSPTPHPRTMGADVRLILPGDGCLLCRGNLSNYAQAVEELCTNHSLEGLQQPKWNQQRAGSLRSLNQLAAALGIQMLQDLVAERIQSSTWAHVEFGNAGHVTVNYPTMPQAPGSSACVLCAKAGLGDEGLMIEE